MTTDEALQFLQSHQPLPATREISDSLLMRYDEVRKHFAENPDKRCVPLLLNSFGEGDGHGVYQLVEDTILAHPESVVIPALKNSLKSSLRSVQEWSAEISANYPYPELIAPLVDILRYGSLDGRLAAVTALEAIGTTDAFDELKNTLNSDVEVVVKDAILEALDL